MICKERAMEARQYLEENKISFPDLLMWSNNFRHINLHKLETFQNTLVYTPSPISHSRKLKQEGQYEFEQEERREKSWNLC